MLHETYSFDDMLFNTTQIIPIENYMIHRQKQIEN